MTNEINYRKPINLNWNEWTGDEQKFQISLGTETCKFNGLWVKMGGWRRVRRKKQKRSRHFS